MDLIKNENIHDNIAVSDQEDDIMQEDYDQDEPIDAKNADQGQIVQQPNVPEAQNIALSNVSAEEALRFFSA